MAAPLTTLPPGFQLDEPASNGALPSGFTVDPPQSSLPSGFTLDPTMGERVTSGAKAAATRIGGYLNDTSQFMQEGQTAAPQESPQPTSTVGEQVGRGVAPILEGLKRGFGDRPLGQFPLYPEDSTDTRRLDLSSTPFVSMLDAALRAPGAGLAGGAALGRQIYSMLGASDTEASQLERELYQLGQAVLLKGSSGVTSPVGYPKGVTRPLTSGEFLARVPGASPIVADFQLRTLKEFGGYTDEMLARMTPEQKQAAYQTWAEGSTVTRPQTGPQLALPPPEGGVPQTPPPEISPEVPPVGPRGASLNTEVAAAAEALRGGQGAVSPFGFHEAPNEVPPVMSPAELGAVPPDLATPTTFPPGEVSIAPSEIANTGRLASDVSFQDTSAPAVVAKTDWKEEAAALRQALEVIKKDAEHWGDLETLHLEGETVVSRRQKLTAPGIEAWAQAPAGSVIDPYSFTVSQSAIDPRIPLLHDGGKVEVSPLETRGIVELARERHGADFDTFVHRTSTAFSDLRDIVAEMPGFAGLKQEGIGVSFAPGYRGVSIRAPVSASFINPGLTKYRDPVRAGAGMAHTMVHELAHHIHRPEVGLEHVMSRIFSHLMEHKTFNFLDFKLRLIKILDEHQPVFHYLNGVMTSGVFPIQSSGTQFQTVGPNEAGNGGRTGNYELSRQPRGGPGEGLGVSGGTAPLGGVADRARVPLEVSSTPHDGTNGRAANQRALDAEALGIPAAERQPETANVLRNLNTVFQAVKGGTPGSVKAAAAHADRMNRVYKYGLGMDQIVERNPNFEPALRYWELDRALRSEERPIHDVSIKLGKRWRSLGAQGENLTGLLDDLANMRYRTPNEVAQDIIRQFTDAEFAALVAKNKVGDKALKLAKDIGSAFSGFLTYTEGVAIGRAIEIGQNNPVALAAKIDQIRQQIAEMRKRPYFPFMRFGLHFVMKKDASGATQNFQTFERRGLVSAEAQQQRVFKEAQWTKAIDEEVTFGMLPENATPLIGMPIPLLNLIKEELDLTPGQLKALEQLQLQHAPGLSFKKRMMTKEYVPGYSMDFQRALLNYFFHGARYYSRVKFAPRMEEQIKAAEAVPNDNKAAMIASYMRNHFKNVVLDAKSDHGIFKGSVFQWTLGYSAYAALQNATQLPMIIFPTLAAKFGGPGIGEARVAKALIKAMANHTNFYKKGYYQKQTEFEMRAIAYGMRTGVLTETQAAMLAGMSAQSNLYYGVASSAAQRGLIHFNEKSSWMFDIIEQFLRRTTFVAALELAQKYPNSAANKTALNERKMEYEALQTVNGGKFTAAQAAAIVTASLWTVRPNFDYDLHARPPFMRGWLPSRVLVFQKYKQSLWALLGNNPDILIRYMLMAALLGGAAAQPLYEEIRALLRFFAKHAFGKDFDLDQKLREWVVQLTGGKIPPDLILHGFARQGFGLPALVDMMGSKPSRGLGVGGTPNSATRNVPFPSFDMSRMVTTGPILPVDIGKILDPNKDINSTIGEQTQRASGALFSVGFNVYKALQSQDPASDIKRWEHVMPRALRDASTGYRAFSEERLRGRGSPNSAPTVIPFDPRDTEQMAEIIGMGLGLTPRRVQEKWDSIMAKVEVEKYYNTRRSVLLEQKFEAVEGRNQQEIEAVQKDIDKYNAEIRGTPAAGKFISVEQQIQSIEGRKRAQVSKEIGIPTQLGNVGISRYIDTLFPETTVDVRRVR